MITLIILQDQFSFIISFISLTNKRHAFYLLNVKIKETFYMYEYGK